MSNSEHCADCQKPVRMVRVFGWDGVRRDGAHQIPLDYVKSIEGEYAVLGPDTAVYVKFEDRARYAGGLYSDHRRTCPKAPPFAGDPDRPQKAEITIACAPGGCCEEKWFLGDASDVLKAAQTFIAEHINCRGRKKAS